MLFWQQHEDAPQSFLSNTRAAASNSAAMGQEGFTRVMSIPTRKARSPGSQLVRANLQNQRIRRDLYYAQRGPISVRAYGSMYLSVASPLRGLIGGRALVVNAADADAVDLWRGLALLPSGDDRLMLFR